MFCCSRTSATYLEQLTCQSARQGSQLHRIQKTTENIHVSDRLRRIVTFLIIAPYKYCYLLTYLLTYLLIPLHVPQPSQPTLWAARSSFSSLACSRVLSLRTTSFRDPSQLFVVCNLQSLSLCPGRRPGFSTVEKDCFHNGGVQPNHD